MIDNLQEYLNITRILPMDLMIHPRFKEEVVRAVRLGEHEYKFVETHPNFLNYLKEDYGKDNGKHIIFMDWYEMPTQIIGRFLTIEDAETEEGTDPE